MAQVTIRRRPFDSKEALQLIPKLDKELAEMYPDWHTLPHPGDDIGLKHKAPDLNLKPKEGHHSQNVISILNEAEPDLASLQGRDNHPRGGDDQNDDNANDDYESGLIYFVAYLTDPTTGETDEQQPVGCMALKVEKYYPHHHPPEMYLDTTIQSQIQRDIEREGNTKTAQLKRLYVEKDYRSTKMKPSVAATLLQHCEEFAREKMRVKRLVVETGIRQVGAIKLYERAGYSQIENFGDYASASVDKGGVSICYEKVL